MSNRDMGREPETIISASVKVEGDFISQGNVLIEGEMEGSLRTDKDLRVGEQARIVADVGAASATVAGEIRGNIEVSERLELESTAKIFGDIHTKNLIVASGALINGRIVMGGMEASVVGAGRMPKTAKAPKTAVKETEKQNVRSEAEEHISEMIEEELAEDKDPVKKTINAFFTK